MLCWVCAMWTLFNRIFELVRLNAFRCRTASLKIERETAEEGKE